MEHFVLCLSTNTNQKRKEEKGTATRNRKGEPVVSWHWWDDPIRLKEEARERSFLKITNNNNNRLYNVPHVYISIYIYIYDIYSETCIVCCCCYCCSSKRSLARSLLPHWSFCVSFSPCYCCVVLFYVLLLVLYNTARSISIHTHTHTHTVDRQAGSKFPVFLTPRFDPGGTEEEERKSEIKNTGSFSSFLSIMSVIDVPDGWIVVGVVSSLSCLLLLLFYSIACIVLSCIVNTPSAYTSTQYTRTHSIETRWRYASRIHDASLRLGEENKKELAR